MESIVGYLEKWAADTPDKMLYTFLDGTAQVVESYTFRQFHERSNHVANRLRETGKVRSGQPILLVYPPGLEMAVAFMACAKLGALPVLVPPPDTSGLIGGIEKLCRMTNDSGATTALTTQSYLQHFHFLTHRSEEAASYLRKSPLSTLDWLPTDTLQGHLPNFQSQPHSLLFLQYTSGSTQNPRGVMVSHTNVIHNCHATLDHQPVGVSWLPHYHDMGLIGYYLFIMLTGGSTVNFSTFNFLKRPFLWLDTLSKVGATITSAPNFAYEYCLREDRISNEKLASLDLSSMRCLMNASEPVRSSTYTRFLERFGPCGLSPQASVVFYGLAENTLSVTGHGRVQQVVNSHLIQQNHLRIEPPRTDGYNQQSLVSCGKPLPGIDVQIVDTDRSVALGEGLIGEIWIAGKSKTAGYWNNPALSQAVFHASISGDKANSTYLRTGDAGFLYEGELFICGRLKDMIIIGGQNYYPADIETVVEGCTPQIRTGCVAAFAIEDAEKGEAIAVIAEAKRADDLPDLEAVCREVQKRCQVDVALLAIVPHGTIAKTSSGKIARQECKTRRESGDVSVLACRRATAKDESDSAIDHFLRHFPNDEHENSTLSDLGIDSLTLVDISLQLDKIVRKQVRFRNSQKFENLYDLRLLQSITVGELRTFLSQSQSNGRSFRFASQPYVKRLRAIEDQEAKSMQQDVDLPEDIAPSGGPAPENGKVLLTGATGFLGSFLLASLLNR
ncbi:MAG: AMP-binding protein, partial [bacterium]|nr:AMP-binding protein [bacterium]